LVEGYVNPGEIHHAWNLIYTKEKGVIAVKIEFDGTWRTVDATFGADMGDFIAEYIGDGSSYTEDYYY